MPVQILNKELLPTEQLSVSGHKESQLRIIPLPPFKSPMCIEDEFK